MNIIDKARQFAIAAHAGQVRKYTGLDYWVHPAQVAVMCNTVGLESRTICAAWLHDVVEDCDGITIKTIAKEFGPIIARHVQYCTAISKPSDGNRDVRKAIDCKHYGSGTPESKSIKIADMLSNVPEIFAYDNSGFGKKYLDEKRALLPALKGGNERLYSAAEKMIELLCLRFEG